MTSTRPYLLRAMHEWMLDNGLTPQIVVDASGESVQVPKEFVEDGRVVLNVSPSAVRELSLGNDEVAFMARFGGRPYRICVETARVMAIVARENGAGLSFPSEERDGDGEPPPDVPPDGPRPRLKVVK
jgi:stringent starvation protein B